jgi:deazaflavin-dependent oxidoreductase (nitroreductase family)
VSEVIAFADANPVHKLLRRLIAVDPVAKVLARIGQPADLRIYRMTRGKHMLSSIISGLPVVLLTSTGARSGERRTSPLLGIPMSDGLAVIASNYGQQSNPNWAHNLRAQPQGEVLVDGRTHRFEALEVIGSERERIWSAGLEIYPGWNVYKQRAGRVIPVFLLRYS